MGTGGLVAEQIRLQDDTAKPVAAKGGLLPTLRDAKDGAPGRGEVVNPYPASTKMFRQAWQLKSSSQMV
jgi:hypothetical protein